MKAIFAALGAATVLTAASAVAAQENPFSGISSGEYALDDKHGYVTFTYSHLGYSQPILRFDDIDATVDLDTESPAQSSLSVTIDPASINSGVEEFDGHLTGEDFFNVAEHDTITFEATSLDMESATEGTVTGDLTIKGITKPVTLDVTLNKAAEHPMLNKDAFGISAKGTLQRSEFDLGAYVPNVGDDVTLMIETEFHKAE